MSQTTKVDVIIKSLSELESEIDSVNLSLADMKKSLNSIAQREIDSLLEQTRKMANSEAESLVSDSKKIAQDGESKISEIQKNIDSNFDSAVDGAVETILKA